MDCVLCCWYMCLLVQLYGWKNARQPTGAACKLTPPKKLASRPACLYGNVYDVIDFSRRWVCLAEVLNCVRSGLSQGEPDSIFQ